jgi:purine-nucleoside phosphorylase
VTVFEFERAKEAADALRARAGNEPAVAIVLGSGLGDFVELIRPAVSVAYGDLPHWPVTQVEGHAGRAVIGNMRGRTVIALAGRSHVYEGHNLASVTFAVRVLGLLGVRVLALTNAAGGINAAFTPGSLMLIDDHLNLMGSNPLVGAHDDRFGPRFPDMSEVYSPRLRRIAREASAASGVPLRHGVYAAVTGPSYETPAEIRYLRSMGVDAVGMSTVPEAVVARQMDMEVLGLSCISNMAAGILPQPLAHSEVLETTRRARGSFSALLEEIVGQL